MGCVKTVYFKIHNRILKERNICIKKQARNLNKVYRKLLLLIVRLSSSKENLQLISNWNNATYLTFSQSPY